VASRAAYAEVRTQTCAFLLFVCILAAYRQGPSFPQTSNLAEPGPGRACCRQMYRMQRTTQTTHGGFALLTWSEGISSDERCVDPGPAALLGVSQLLAQGTRSRPRKGLPARLLCQRETLGLKAYVNDVAAAARVEGRRCSAGLQRDGCNGGGSRERRSGTLDAMVKDLCATFVARWLRGGGEGGTAACCRLP
jgi:hypothetical protein